MVPENLSDNGDAPLDILNAGHKRNIKIANISILNYIETPYKKTKTQIFNNSVIILKDSLIGVISNINNNNLLTTGYSSQIFMAFFPMIAKINYQSQVLPELNY